jgi:hypothetical protein
LPSVHILRRHPDLKTTISKGWLASIPLQVSAMPAGEQIRVREEDSHSKDLTATPSCAAPLTNAAQIDGSVFNLYHRHSMKSQNQQTPESLPV